MFLLNKNIRREVKFKIFNKDVGNFYSWLYNSYFKKKYNDRIVNSLYYDTTNFDFASDNISGQSNRLKIRLRWYSNSKENHLENFCNNKYFNFEIKRKKNNLSDKIIFSKIFLENKNSLIDRRNYLKEKLKNEISKFKDLSSLVLNDIIFINYSRSYYEHFLSENIRLTIDKNISCYLCLNNSIHSNTNINNDFSIVEIKFKQENDKEVKKILKNFPFRQVRSSKYLYALSKYLRFSY